MRADDGPTTAPHNRTCKEAFPLLLFFWWFFLAKGIWMEHKAKRGAR